MNAKRLGIFSWYGFRSPLAERLERIRAAGFYSTMLWWGDEPAFSEHSPQEVVELARGCGLVIENIHVPFDRTNDLWSSDRDIRESTVGRHKTWIRQASDHGIPIMVMHASRGTNVAVANAGGILAVESLVREAEKRNVVVALENTSAVYLLESVLASIDSANLRVCYDTSHGQLSGGHGFNLMSELGDRISCFHISDNDGLEDRHWNIGEGVIDWDGFAEAFPEAYSGALSVEVLPKDTDTDESAFLAGAFDRLLGLAEKIEAAGTRKCDGN